MIAYGIKFLIIKAYNFHPLSILIVKLNIYGLKFYLQLKCITAY